MWKMKDKFKEDELMIDSLLIQTCYIYNWLEGDALTKFQF